MQINNQTRKENDRWFHHYRAKKKSEKKKSQATFDNYHARKSNKIKWNEKSRHISRTCTNKNQINNKLSKKSKSETISVTEEEKEKRNVAVKLSQRPSREERKSKKEIRRREREGGECRTIGIVNKLLPLKRHNRREKLNVRLQF